MEKKTRIGDSENITWKFCRDKGKIGTGNWEAYPIDHLPEIFEAAKFWKNALKQVKKPWLCWCVDEDWCVVQQKLVSAVGWTPVVGTDGRFSNPSTIPGALFLDFNAPLKLPVMWMHFVLDFVHLYCEKLAFWHSDVLPPVAIMKEIAEQFDGIENGQLMAVKKYDITLGDIIRRFRKNKPILYKRWLEVIGCTTKNASQDMFEKGCGWWRNPQFHPNAQKGIQKMRLHWEHGVGIWLWDKHFDGQTIDLCIDISPYHYSNSHPLYQRQKDKDGRISGSKHSEMNRSFDLNNIISGLGMVDCN